MPDTKINSNEYYGESKFSEIEQTIPTVNNAEFYDCDFCNCNFAELKFNNCSFEDCRFDGCDLSLTDFSGTKFIDTAFKNCKMIGINWTKAYWSGLASECPVEFTKCNLNHSIFLGLELKKLRLVNSQVKNADFRDCLLSESNFSGSDLSETMFFNADLSKANFCSAYNYFIDVKNSIVKKAKFTLPEAVNLLKGLNIIIKDS